MTRKNLHHPKMVASIFETCYVGNQGIETIAPCELTSGFSLLGLQKSTDCAWTATQASSETLDEVEVPGNTIDVTFIVIIFATEGLSKSTNDINNFVKLVDWLQQLPL